MYLTNKLSWNLDLSILQNSSPDVRDLRTDLRCDLIEGLQF